MVITIEGVSVTPTWDTLQDAIRQMLDNEEGVIVRISRRDGGCSYRTAGEYDLEFCPRPTGDMVNVTLIVRQS
jgi:Fe-S cluster assembly iron-binding protein IscA